MLMCNRCGTTEADASISAIRVAVDDETDDYSADEVFAHAYGDVCSECKDELCREIEGMLTPKVAGQPRQRIIYQPYIPSWISWLTAFLVLALGVAVMLLVI